MFTFDSSFYTSTGALILAAAALVLLMWLLRRMGVRAKYLAWTLAAHVAFIVLLGMSVAPTTLSSKSLTDDAMAVVMLPPLVDQQARPDESFVRPVVRMRVVPPEDLPDNPDDASRASQFLGAPSSQGVANARLQAIAPRDNAAELGAMGVPTRRTDAGEIGGSSISATPRQMTTIADSQSPALVSIEQRGDRAATNMYDRSRADTRVEVAGPDVERSGEIGLPSGYKLGGDVQGREIRYLPPLPEIQGTDAGTVKVRFWVSSDGRVYDVNIIKRSGYPKLEQEARRWVERLQFAPLDPTVSPKAQYGEIEIDFSKFL